MADLVDPIALLAQKMKTMSSEKTTIIPKTGVPFEVPLQPAPGARLERLTIASTYRTPIPVLYDPASRTTYPISSEG